MPATYLSHLSFDNVWLVYCTFEEFLLPQFIKKKKFCVATMAKTQQVFFNYRNGIVMFHFVI